MKCPSCGTEADTDTAHCDFCGAQMPHNPYSSETPPVLPSGQHGDTEGDATGGIIPYKNPHALVAYYLGIVSGLPLIGFPFGIAAFVLGISGLRARKKNPVIKGSVHAGIGIGCGALFTVLWGAVIIGLVIASLG